MACRPTTTARAHIEPHSLEYYDRAHGRVKRSPDSRVVTRWLTGPVQSGLGLQTGPFGHYDRGVANLLARGAVGAETIAEPLQAAVVKDGFAFVDAARMRELLSRFGQLSDWAEFVTSWDELALDTYMGDGGRYRRRRHAVYAAAPGGPILRQPDQPHYQSLDYNPLNGGIARWFDPIDLELGSGPTIGAILTCSRAIFEALTPARLWHIEVHQFRIEARVEEPGRPTPEGIHRDGVDYVLVLLIDRYNVISGTTTVQALDGRQLGSFTLSAPLDAAFLDDTRVAHGVTAIEPLDPGTLGRRDVLVVTWRRLEHPNRQTSPPRPRFSGGAPPEP